jgi:uncharacterized membrane protein
MADIRHASIEPGSPGSAERFPGPLAQSGPFALLAIGAVWLYLRFDELPARIPIHWNWRGEPDRFVSRTVPGAALPLLLGTAICVLMLAMQRGLRRNTPRGDMRAPSIKLVLAGEYLGALVCVATLAASVTGGRLLWLALALGVGGAVSLLGYALVAARRAPKEPLRNPAAWRGLFYFDRDDPALFVPKRVGLGYTFNFGHPGAIVLVVLLLLVPFLATAAAMLAR